MSDGTVATDGSKIRAIWSLRERVPEAFHHHTEGVSYRVSYFHKYSSMHITVCHICIYVQHINVCVCVVCV